MIRGIPDFLDSKIDVNTVAMYLGNMTQKKTVDTQRGPASMGAVDKLIESGNVAAMISRYVDLTMQATKLRDHLMADPAIASAISGLIPKQDTVPWGGPPLRQGIMIPMASDDNPLGATIPTQITSNAIAPGAQEPLGTIHKDVPISYEYPMDEYTQVGNQSKDRVMEALGKLNTTTSGYQGIDPQGEIV